jgi:hypothetical protein
MQTVYIGNTLINDIFLGSQRMDDALQIEPVPPPTLPITGGLVFYVDAGLPASYAGSGASTVNGLNYVTGTPRTGTLSGGFTSLYGGAFTLSASAGNGIPFTDSGMPSGSQSRTLGAWVYNDAAGGNPLWYGTASPNAGIGIQQIGTNGPTFRFYGYANDFDTAVTNMWNRWVYMVGTFDGTDARIYLNGSLIATSNRSGWNTTLSGTLTVGRTQFGGSPGNFVNGYLGQAQIYNRALSDSEVLQNYNTFSSRFS